MLRQLTRTSIFHARQRFTAKPGLVALPLSQSCFSSHAFHTSSRRQAPPLVPFFAALLKASGSLEFARMTGRIAMTFMPVILLKNWKTLRKIKYATLHGVPTSEENKEKALKQIRNRKFVLYGLFLIPLSLFLATIIASLEKTPLTGRWRVIILSPEEEEEITRQLAGQGWYNAVWDILAQDGSPKLMPSSDWKYQWVNDTLRRLETTIPILTDEHPQWLSGTQDSPPMPPPAPFPLHSRPRASEYLRRFCDHLCDPKKSLLAVTPSHTIQGPPYSFLIVDKPGVSNAFSYGFGSDGAGGIVIYSGFLDEILARKPAETMATTSSADKSWFSWLFGSLFSRPAPPPMKLVPTAEQTSELAILLAHELSHLILAHHLEHLSSTTIIIPGTISFVTDIVRVLLFPVTMLFGPFVNDALAQLGKMGSLEFSKVGVHCNSMTQEIEADVVSARLLAHAGFDARQAIKFWEIRSSDLHERPALSHDDTAVVRPVTGMLVQRIMGSTHPENDLRVTRLKEELARWEAAKESALLDLKMKRGESGKSAAGSS